MGLETNPGYRPGTVPVCEHLHLDPELNEIIHDLVALLGQTGAVAAIRDLLNEAPREILPARGCRDFLTYR